MPLDEKRLRFLVKFGTSDQFRNLTIGDLELFENDLDPKIRERVQPRLEELRGTK